MFINGEMAAANYAITKCFFYDNMCHGLAQGGGNFACGFWGYSRCRPLIKLYDYE